MEIEGTPAAELAALDWWTESLADVRRRIAPRFRRVAVRERADRSLAVLLAWVERKNGWQLAEAIGEGEPHRVQRLLDGVVWDADVVRDDVRADVVAHRGEVLSGVFIVDEAGCLKQGERSCGSPPIRGMCLGRAAAPTQRHECGRVPPSAQPVLRGAAGQEWEEYQPRTGTTLHRSRPAPLTGPWRGVG